MTQGHSDTSDRLYTRDELDRYAAAAGDPLTDPLGPPPSWTPDQTREVPVVEAVPPPPPAPAPPPPAAAAPPVAPPVAPSVASPAAAPAGVLTEEPRRFMTATDFLDRRAEETDSGPATWGWRGLLNRWSGGLSKLSMGSAEQAHEQQRSLIQRDFDGPRTIAFINPKGGAAKTTGVLATGYTFGTVRGGGVVAWDNNETRGTLGIRGTRSTHRNTTRELLEDLERFTDVYQSRIGEPSGLSL